MDSSETQTQTQLTKFYTASAVLIVVNAGATWKLTEYLRKEHDAPDWVNALIYGGSSFMAFLAMMLLYDNMVPKTMPAITAPSPTGQPA